MANLGLAMRGVLGRGVGLALAPAIFGVSAYRRARAVHAEGLLCRAEVSGVANTFGERLTGPALVRFSGAFGDEGAPKPDILGLAIRFRRAADGDDPKKGDQDLLTATFNSFATANEDKKHVDVTDYLSVKNTYNTVAPWCVDEPDGEVVAQLAVRLANNGTARDPARGVSRKERLLIDIARGDATLALSARVEGAPPVEIATIQLIALLPGDGRTLRESLRRTGRGLVAAGFQNGIRRVVYPVSQLARTLTGG